MAMLNKVRQLVQEYTNKQLYESAVYWADKALSLSSGDMRDLAVYAQTLTLCGKYQSAIHILQSSPMLHHSTALKYLAARCHAACKEWEEVLALLHPTADAMSPDPTPLATKLDIPSLGNIQSASLVLQGTAYEGLGNLPEAIECYKQALSMDVFCEEALEKLFQYHYLSPDEEKALFSQLHFKKQCSVEEEKFLVQLYRQKMHHVKQSSVTLDKELQPLSTNPDILTTIAEKYFRSMNIDACYQLTSEIVEKDPYHDPALLLYIACCVQKSKVEELFSLAHRLVNYFPQKPLSWYCVACYYLSVKKHQDARKYLTKAITVNPNFPPAHLAFGVSFATEGEHDQAITAFSSAARVMRGSHLPLMYLGKEYCLTGLMPTAVKFMKSALSMAPSDPVLAQEIGVMLANSGSYEKAEKHLQQAIRQLKVVDPHVTLQAWEPIYNNLGHVYRKVKKYELALEMHNRALQLEPKQAATLTAVAFVHLLMGSYVLAVEVANQSLRLKREDQFALEVLHYALDEFADPVVEPEPGNGIETLEDLESELLATDESFNSPTSGEKNENTEAVMTA